MKKKKRGVAMESEPELLQVIRFTDPSLVWKLLPSSPLLGSVMDRTFFCLVNDEQKPFQVSISENANIYALKKAIRFEGQKSSFRDVDAKNLALFKVQ